MRVIKLLHTLLKKAAPILHAKRIMALLNAAESLMIGKRLTLSGLARSIRGNCLPKTAIRKIDRLLGNKHIHSERTTYYKCLCITLLSGITSPLISIDWTGVPSQKYCLRASVNIKGRAFVLYEEVYLRKYEKSNHINHRFLDRLKSIIPENASPIIITDAGFRSPWFKKVLSLGWNFLGRVRNDNNYFDFKLQIWNKTYDLYKKATDAATYVGKVLYTKKEKLDCSMYLYKGKIKGRKNYNKRGKISQRRISKVHSKSHRDPLLLVTSLNSSQYTATQIINLYKRRMEIEEEFRDLKDPRNGFGLKYSGTKSTARIQVLLLIAALASFMCWLIALTLKRRKEHYAYQANTVRDKNVLSVHFLACEALRRFGRKIKISISDIMNSLNEIKHYCLEASYG